MDKNEIPTQKPFRQNFSGHQVKVAWRSFLEFLGELGKKKTIDKHIDLDDYLSPDQAHFSKHRFFGQIFPDNSGIAQSEPTVLGFQGYDGTNFIAKFEFSNSSFSVEVRSDSNDLATLRNLVENKVRFLLDSIGYLNNCYFNAHITSAIDAENNTLNYNTCYTALCSRNIPDISSAEISKLCEDEPLRLALSDIRRAMEEATETGVFCYRAVESLKQHFTTPGASDTKNWAAMNSSLNTSKGFIESKIKTHADKRRHGAISFITGPDRDACMFATTQIIDRYIAYLKSEKTPLDKAIFPPL